MADLQCRLKFCSRAMWLSYTHKKIHSFPYFFSCGLSLDIEYSSLLSTVGLCCLSFYCFLNCQSSTHHTLLHGSRVYGPFLVLDELSHALKLIKPLDTYQKREINPRTLLGLDIGGGWGVTDEGSDWLMCVSDSPRILAVSAISTLKRTQTVDLQRPGSWVTSSWGSTSRFMIEEMTGLAWHRQCKRLEWFKNQ